MASKKKAEVVTTPKSPTIYAIHSDIPMPERAARGRAGRFPFDQLKEKQCFTVTLKEEDVTDLAKLNSRMRSAVYSAGKRLGIKFVVEADPKAGSVTVWRAPSTKA